MKIAFMLLHDFRFAGWSLDDFLIRYHFSKEYSSRLTKRGHNVILYILHQDAASIKTIEHDGFTIKVFPTQFNFPPIPGFGYSHNLQVTKELFRDKPDVIHFNNYYLWSFPYIARWAKRSGIRVVCQYHGASDILLPAKKAFIPLFQGVEKYLVGKDEEIEYLTGSLGIPAQKVLKFPNVGVDTELFRPSGKKTPEPSLLYVGRMPKKPRNLREKSPWLLLDIMEALAITMPQVSLHMVGDGPSALSLKKAAEEKRIERNVIFHGYINNCLLPPLYSSSWATFIPLQLERIDPFWDGSLKESLACSTPVIGFNENFKDYGNGCQRLGHLVPPNPMVAAKIIEEILGNQTRLKEMGMKGRKEVLGCCSWDSVIVNLEKVYHS